MAVVRGLIRTNRRTGSNWADLFMPVGPDERRLTSMGLYAMPPEV